MYVTMIFLFTEDGVYMENEMWRDEYILNDVGKIYAGNYKQIGAKPWNFGQVLESHWRISLIFSFLLERRFYFLQCLTIAIQNIYNNLYILRIIFLQTSVNLNFLDITPLV